MKRNEARWRASRVAKEPGAGDTHGEGVIFTAQLFPGAGARLDCGAIKQTPDACASGHLMAFGMVLSYEHSWNGVLL